MRTAALIVAVLAAAAHAAQANDWLVTPFNFKTRLVTIGPNTVSLTNGLIARTFRTAPNFATVDFRRLSDPNDPLSGTTFFRGISPEAILTMGQLNPVNVSVGGLIGQKDFQYFDPELWNLTSDPKAFQFSNYIQGPPEPEYHWEHQRHADNATWPPAGLRLTVNFTAPAASTEYAGVIVTIIYEMYDGIPTMAKWVHIHALPQSTGAFVQFLCTEQIHVPEHLTTRLHVITDYMPRHVFWETTNWPDDPYYHLTTNVWWNDPDYQQCCDEQLWGDYEYRDLLLNISYPLGPAAVILPGAGFRSFRSFLILQDSDDEERQTLARRRMYRIVAPQVTENPIYFYLSDATKLRGAIDQCHAVGFEMIIQSFYSGFDPTDLSPDTISRTKALYDYAHTFNIEVGGYTFMQGPPNMPADAAAINPNTGTSWGSACFATEFHARYREKVMQFINMTGQDMLETDGPFEGVPCGSTTHTGHRGVGDSQWTQDLANIQFYKQLKNQNIYLTVPDPYWLSGGTNKQPIGYTDKWSHMLDPWIQVDTGRMYVYDGTYHYTPSMGWIGFELGGYKNLTEAIDVYDWAMASYIGQGIVTCWRGPIVYDSDTTRLMVTGWLNFYKRHRPIITADLIHVMRPNGRDADLMMHVSADPRNAERALGIIFNPSTKAAYNKTVTLPMYYSGIAPGARVRLDYGGARATPLGSTQFTVNADGNVVLPPMALKPRTYWWFVISLA